MILGYPYFRKPPNNYKHFKYSCKLVKICEQTQGNGHIRLYLPFFSRYLEGLGIFIRWDGKTPAPCFSWDWKHIRILVWLLDLLKSTVHAILGLDSPAKRLVKHVSNYIPNKSAWNGCFNPIFAGWIPVWCVLVVSVWSHRHAKGRYLGPWCTGTCGEHPS